MLWLISKIKTIVEKLQEIKLPKFLQNFLTAMDNTQMGQSLKKWLAVGFFWLTVHVTIRNTTEKNLELVLTILCTTLLALVGIEHIFKYKVKALETKDTKTPPDGTDEVK